MTLLIALLAVPPVARSESEPPRSPRLSGDQATAEDSCLPSGPAFAADTSEAVERWLQDLDRCLEAESFRAWGPGQAAAPSLGSASLRLDEQIHLGPTADVYRDGEVFLWTDGSSDSPGGSLGLGLHALESSTGSNNTAIGHIALRNNTTGAHNTAVGEDVLANNTTGSYNTAVGEDALVNNTTGWNNTALGMGALLFSVTGIGNTATGAEALRSNYSGVFNTGSGWRALRHNTSGGFNTAMGTDALYYNSDGFANSAVGVSALVFNTTGDSNTAIGVDSLSDNVSGSNNIAIGRNGGRLITGDKNIAIGSYGAASESYTLRIGGGGTHELPLERVFIRGIRGASGSFDQEVCVDVAQQLGPCSSSSRRFKEEIEPMGEASATVHQLRPVRYRYTEEFTGEAAVRPVEFGLIAEEVAAIFPNLVSYDDAGRPSSVRYSALTPLLLNELQRQRAEIDRLQRVEERLDALEAALRPGQILDP